MTMRSLAISLLMLTQAQAALKYVATTGNDGNAGTSGAPYATINKALDVCAAGDSIFVAAGSYTENPIVKTSGSVSAAVSVTGTDASFGATTLRSVTVTGRFTTSLASGTQAYYRFENIAQTGATATGWALPLHYCTWINCSASSNTGATTDGFTYRDACIFQRCQADNNGRDGFGGAASTSDKSAMHGCVAFSNGRDGFRADRSAMTWVNCVAYSNVGNGFTMAVAPASCCMVINCTSDGNGVGIAVGGRFVLVANCIISNNTTGLSGYSSDGRNCNPSYNVVYNNGTARTNFPVGTGDITSDPLFTNRAGGDFTLQVTSPAKALGLPAYLDAGAYQLQDSSGRARAACP